MMCVVRLVRFVLFGVIVVLGKCVVRVVLFLLNDIWYSFVLVVVISSMLRLVLVIV